MSKVFGYLAVIIPLTLIVIIGVQLYYLFIRAPKSVKKPIASDQIAPTVTSPTPSPLGYLSNAVDNNTLVSSLLVSNFEGEITEINHTGGIVNNFEYQTKIAIKGEGQNPTPFFASKQMLGIIKVIRIEGDKEMPITINDLAVGNKVTIRTVYKYNSQARRHSQFVESEIKKL